MSEARKLDESGLPEIPVDGMKLKHDAALPPLPATQPAAYLGEAALPSGNPVRTGEAEHAKTRPSAAVKKKKKGGFGRALLILTLIGMVSFAGGASLTAGIVLGNIDTKSGRLKETLDSAKVFIKQLRN
jgi:hypothetical protein